VFAHWCKAQGYTARIHAGFILDRKWFPNPFIASELCAESLLPVKADHRAVI
jgi:hypothetical protein